MDILKIPFKNIEAIQNIADECFNTRNRLLQEIVIVAGIEPPAANVVHFENEVIFIEKQYSKEKEAQLAQMYIKNRLQLFLINELINTKNSNGDLVLCIDHVREVTFRLKEWAIGMGFSKNIVNAFDEEEIFSSVWQLIESKTN
ncbi:hypothetical protein HN512_03025 [Candidatus Peregrinibacteria bacterium]|jgi:hypothetical protein|nr:hypothetical protein [Candidatus Peregrinibacteria bacterium]MBT3598785.1 hypothetical protein [Candidatus Peregrinibacteria bacterium]MBT4367373.1 hypothetical protein [Candidatus Peregrinibacteria bacterium]MBT4585853.1 hypothetical protein [Candidatus Peregrinibacteria bacterium]MBT6731205.1 hypothetical protein [Candidatus Peregrinibacteria bacterium]